MAKVKVHDGAETPSQVAVNSANAVTVVKDALGREIGIKKMLTLDRLRMFEVVGPENSKNDQYLGYAALAFSVVSIDGVAYSRPTNKLQLEALVQHLGDEGMEAVGSYFADLAESKKSEAEQRAEIKN